MAKYYIKKKNTKKLKLWLKLLSLLILIAGLGITGFIFFPLISWQIYFAPVFASQNISSPIPKNTIVNSSTIQNLISDAKKTISGVDYTNATNWFPNYVNSENTAGENKLLSYTLSIPKIDLKDAVVSTVDTDLSKHLVNYIGTAIPPQNGNAVVFGHSTLPQLFNPKDYKTILANAYKLTVGDEIYVVINNISYLYKVQSITVVDPDDMSVFFQNYDSSYLTLITCTPPGTIWKRLVIKAKLLRI